MLKNTVARRLAQKKDEDQGFTLIELMVVVLIIAILIAIAIPTFLGARTRAQDRAAQSSLRNALTAAKTAYTDVSDYSKATNADLTAIEPSLQYVAGGVSSADLLTPVTPSFKVVSVDVSSVATGDNQVWSAAVLSKSGKCFYIHDQATGTGAGTFYGSAAGPACLGTAAVTANAGSF
jgi:type IV pilus assembly protein PilA